MPDIGLPPLDGTGRDMIAWLEARHADIIRELLTARSRRLGPSHGRMSPEQIESIAEAQCFDLSVLIELVEEHGAACAEEM